VSALMTDLNPAAGGVVTVGFEETKAVVTWKDVPFYGSTSDTANVQVILSFL
jgi:hypothetical protein